MALSVLSPLASQEPKAEAPPPSDASQVDDLVHDQLRKLRTNVEAATAAGDWQSLTQFLTSQVIVTWLDGTQSHGPAAVVEYLESKSGGPDPIVEKFSLTTDVKELSDLYGENTATAYGTATSNFVLRGRELSISGPWSATMVRENGQWKLAALSASVGAFDNPVLTWTWRLVWIVGVIAGLLGLVVGWFSRRPKPSSAKN
jgi:hypothetical protein